MITELILEVIFQLLVSHRPYSLHVAHVHDPIDSVVYQVSCLAAEQMQESPSRMVQLHNPTGIATFLSRISRESC